MTLTKVRDTGMNSYTWFWIDDNKKIVDLFAEVSEEADKQKQFATSNLVQSLMETHGKFHWMLRSVLE